MAQKTLLTAADLYTLDSDRRFELVEGELIEMSPAAPLLGFVAMRLGTKITVFIEERNLGFVYAAETGFRLRRDPDTVRAPDIAFVARDRITPDMDPTHYFDLAPDLAMEVISPSDRATDVMRKVAEYLAAGVRLVWAVYPPLRSVQVFPGGQMLGPEDELSGGDVLPGFACRIADLFPESVSSA